jgi:hypothetical protein
MEKVKRDRSGGGMKASWILQRREYSKRCKIGAKRSVAG